jgi:hypothetical protein
VTGLAEHAEVAVAANVETPYVRNARSLLVCALARFQSLGLAREAARTRAASGYTASSPT